MLTATTGPTLRIRAEGRADGEPLASNVTAEDRALNRRVDILIK
jgi:type VI secretion system protein ImpK